MSLRPIRLAGGLLLTSLAFGLVPAAPAFADGMITAPARHHVRHARHHVWHAPRVIERVRVVNRYVPVYVQQPAPQPIYYQSACGGCGSHPSYLAPAPVQYNYGTSCGGCGYGVARSTYYNAGGYVGSDYEEYGPTYTTGYTGAYIGSGYLRGGLRFSRRIVGREAGFRRSFGGRSFGGRRARFH